MTLFEKVERLKLIKKRIGEVGLSTIEKDKMKFFVVSGMEDLLKAIEMLEEMNMFYENTSSLQAFNLIASQGYISVEQGGNFNRILDTLKVQLNAVYNELVKISGETKVESIYIKLPPLVDFKQLSKATETFDKILSQAIINETIGGQVIIEGVENGSIWMKVYVGTISAVTLIGGVTWSATVAYKKYQEGKYIEQLVRQQDLQNDHKEVLIDAQKKLTDIIIDAEANHLYHEYFNKEDSDPEQINRLKLSVKLLSEEISKGAEILPSLTAPEEAKNAFPDMKNLPSIESRIKKIEDKK